jgi:hypothetical protein
MGLWGKYFDLLNVKGQKLENRNFFLFLLELFITSVSKVMAFRRKRCFCRPLFLLRPLDCGFSATGKPCTGTQESCDFIPELADFYSPAESVVPLNRKASRVVFSPDGRLVLLADKNGDVYQYPAPLATKPISNNLGTVLTVAVACFKRCTGR